MKYLVYCFPASELRKWELTVTWVNDDNVPHTITSVSGSFDSGSIDPGKTYSYKFNQAGTFEYSCTNHPSMPHGKVVVKG